MIALLVCAAALAVSDPEGPSTEARLAYQEARARAGKSPAEQVRLALWCEAHGLSKERLNHLALAVLTDPRNAAARGLMGLVLHEGRYQRPEAVAEKAQADPTLAEYDGRRSKAPYTANGQWALAVWAEEHGLKAQARAHFTAVVRLDPSREAAWKRLGCRKYDGRWMTDEQVAAQQADAEAQLQADRSWSGLLEKWRGWLGQADRRAEAEFALDGVADPRAVPSITRVFASGGAGDQAVAVRLLDRVNTPASSRTLAVLAARGRSPAVRGRAAAILGRRDAREYVGFLLGMVRDPIRYESGMTVGPDGRGRRTLLIEGKYENYDITFQRPAGYMGPPRMFDDSIPFDPTGQQAAFALSSQIDPASTQALMSMVSSAQAHSPAPGGPAHPAAPAAHPAASASGILANQMVNNAMSAASQREQEVAYWMDRPADSPNYQLYIQQLEAANAAIGRSNSEVYAALGAITGQKLPEGREPWKFYLASQTGYAYRSPQERPTAIQEVKPTFQISGPSCFAAGTPVRTIAGDRPIESIRVGDQVLAQDTETGGLGFRSVVVVHHNPPAPTLRVRIGDDDILPTVFHRFWQAGKGWVMARDLKPGDVIRTLGGLARVSAVDLSTTRPVFNLDVADDQTYFVGRAGVLVHDNSLPDPRALPFDAVPETLGAKPAR